MNKGNHPIFSPFGFRIETLQLLYLKDTLKRWIWLGATGGYIEGLSRVGKTTAIEMVLNSLTNRSGDLIPSMMITMPERDTKTIRAVHINLCESFNIAYQPRATSDDLTNSWCIHLAELCLIRNSNTFVLFVDEMQRIIPKQFNAFAELHDKMRIRGILLVVIFLGNHHESDRLIRAVGTKTYSHIQGRFFVNNERFHGIRKETELTHCLRQYDNLCYPENSAISYTEYFLPEDYKSGWRLSDQSKLLWSCFWSIKKEHQFESIGMQYILATIRPLLTDYLPALGVERLNEEMVLKCIELSGLPKSQITFVD
ncbi:AAA family ATPase [Glaciecola sp. MF2-115]|uniref:AAA family ATPase n=1 Tax=Glaciecola sp. MF2-115 TaxID=3384827 RepID=UPI00399F56BE